MVKKKKDDKKTTKKKETRKGIVRLATKDLDGNLSLEKALLYIKGISHSTKGVIASKIEEKFKIKRTEKIGNLSDQDIEKIDEFLFNLSSEDIPHFLVNRQKDIFTGKDLHIIMNDLEFAKREDIKSKERNRTWQGYRHSRNKKVRGQRTRNTGRRGLSVGVIRKKK